MSVRAATEADLGEIAALIAELADFEESADEVALDPEDLRRHLFGPSPAAHVLVAHPPGHPDEVAGMALWFRTYSTWVGRPGVWLEDLFIRPAHRRAGLAGELMAALAEHSEGRVEWAVLDWNTQAIAFYDGMGAAPVPGWTRYRWVPGPDR